MPTPTATSVTDSTDTRVILGVRFFRGNPKEAVEKGLAGGLVVAPSAPVMTRMEHDGAHREAILGSDLAITDSGLMVLLWRVLAGQKLTRISGFEYLKLLLEQPQLRRPGAVLWVMPSDTALERNLVWLRSEGHPVTERDCYVAPQYAEGELADGELLELVRGRRFEHIIICLGGGVQERLGYFLRRNLDYRPGIHCVGAAIGFLSGEQVRIPMWADFLYLGWLFRCLSQPTRFVPRYWNARRLGPLMWRYRERAPELRAAA